jgi:hypothetical protein
MHHPSHTADTQNCHDNSSCHASSVQFISICIAMRGAFGQTCQENCQNAKQAANSSCSSCVCQARGQARLTLPHADCGFSSISCERSTFCTAASASALPQVQFLQAFLPAPTSQSLIAAADGNILCDCMLTSSSMLH